LHTQPSEESNTPCCRSTGGNIDPSSQFLPPGIRNKTNVYPSSVSTKCFSKLNPFDVTISSIFRFSSSNKGFCMFFDLLQQVLDFWGISTSSISETNFSKLLFEVFFSCSYSISILILSVVILLFFSSSIDDVVESDEFEFVDSFLGFIITSSQID